MKQKVYFILFIGFLLLSMFLGFKLYEVHVQKHDNNQTIVNPKTDTTYSKKPFKPIPQYKFIQVPKLVMFFNDPEVRIDTVYVDSSKVHYRLPTGSIEFNHQFLLKYQNSQKLVQITTNKNTLSLTQLDKNGLIHTDKFTNFYPEVNSYNYQDGVLTYKRKPFLQRFNIDIDVTVRPIINMYDLNLGLKYKTRKTYYEIGLNSYFYPTVDPKFGYTPYLRVGLIL